MSPLDDIERINNINKFIIINIYIFKIRIYKKKIKNKYKKKEI